MYIMPGWNTLPDRKEDSAPLIVRLIGTCRWPLSMGGLLLLPILLVLSAALAPLGASSPGHAQVPIGLGVDVDPNGNTATSIGNVDDCVEVDVGDVLSVDLYVSDVQRLSAWEIPFQFNPSVLEVIDHSYRLFLPGISFDISDPVPDADGRHFFGVASFGESSGSGVLARITMQAKAAGRSPAALLYLDFNGDGRIDLGPRLNPGSQPLGDGNGDGIYDGPPAQAEVAVGESCTPSTLTPVSTPGPTHTPVPVSTPGQTPAPNGSPIPLVLLPEAAPSLSDSLSANGGNGALTPSSLASLADSARPGSSGEGLVEDTEAEGGAAGALGAASTPQASDAQDPATGSEEDDAAGSTTEVSRDRGDSSFALWLLAPILAVLASVGTGASVIALILRNRP